MFPNSLPSILINYLRLLARSQLARDVPGVCSLTISRRAYPCPRVLGHRSAYAVANWSRFCVAQRLSVVGVRREKAALSSGCKAVHGEFVNHAAIGIWNRPRQWYPGE
jgi:hypothetical protein